MGLFFLFFVVFYRVFALHCLFCFVFINFYRVWEHQRLWTAFLDDNYIVPEPFLQIGQNITLLNEEIDRSGGSLYPDWKIVSPYPLEAEVSHPIPPRQKCLTLSP